MIISLLAVALGGQIPPSVPSACALADEHSTAERASASVGPMDLMRLRDIGGLSDEAAPFTVSPDGLHVAVAVREAVVEANSYCTRLLMVDLRARTFREITKIEGNVILDRGDMAGRLANFGSGVMRTLLPQWAPDGRSLAYLEKRSGIDQIMIVSKDGEAPSRQISHAAIDVMRFQWAHDGSHVEYLARPEEVHQQQAIEDEGKKGFRFDDRWVPMWKFRPFIPATAAHRFSIDLATGVSKEMPFKEMDDDYAQSAANLVGSRVELLPKDTSFVNSPKVIQFHSPVKSISCDIQTCAQADRVWLHPSRNLVYFLRHAGWSDSMSQIVRWDPEKGESRVLIETEDKIDGCRAARAHLVCAIDGTLQPRRLELVDYETGKRETLFDPNPEWQKKRKATVRAMRWHNAQGLECFAKLILPTARKRPLRKLPLILIGYQNRGFARGGSGDYFPILPFVEEGYAVLYYQLPSPAGLKEPLRNWQDLNRRNMENWADFRSFSSEVDTALAKLENEGLIDRQRVGLTGFSAGTQRGAFMLAQGSNFRAASFIGCCGGPISRDLFIGPFSAESFREMGYPSMRDGVGEHANDFDLAPNAERVSTPILVQSGDREFLAGLQTADSFSRYGKVFDFYIYPDEFHVFWQPIHRLAVYARNLVWFDKYIMNRNNIWAESFLKTDFGYSQDLTHLSASTSSSRAR